MICKRCGKPLADSEDEARFKADRLVNDKQWGEAHMTFDETLCSCDSHIGSVCTSRPLPPNLDAQALSIPPPRRDQQVSLRRILLLPSIVRNSAF
jgi:hypothetical protein